jgi:hypothetical protein
LETASSKYRLQRDFDLNITGTREICYQKLYICQWGNFILDTELVII